MGLDAPFSAAKLLVQFNLILLNELKMPNSDPIVD
jgi:hypothetical protein